MRDASKETRKTTQILAGRREEKLRGQMSNFSRTAPGSGAGKRSLPPSIQRAFGLNVKLCQQKLYKTASDGALGTSSARRKPAAEGQGPCPGEKGPAPGVPGKMATEAAARGRRRGRLAGQAGRTPPPLHARSLRGGRGAGRKLPAGKPGARGGAGRRAACWEAGRALLHGRAPRAPRIPQLPLPAQAPPPETPPRFSGRRAPRELLNLLNHSFPLTTTLSGFFFILSS